MRFGHLDLNLLVALDALLTERSITLAGQQLNLSQVRGQRRSWSSARLFRRRIAGAGGTPNGANCGGC